MGQTAIVLGATGLVGAALVDCLARATHISKVITLTRRPDEVTSNKIENHIVDFDHLIDVKHLFKADILFSCLGTTIKQAGSIKAQRIVDVDYQLEAAKLASEQGVKRYLLVSASGANANSFSQYMKMKGELEDKVQKLTFEHISIFQPSLLLGERRESRAGERFGAIVMSTLCKLPGFKRYRPITGKQVAQKMVSVSTQEDPPLIIKLDDIFPD